jgi:hypothetical protein
VTEYQVMSSRCCGCGHVSEPAATDVAREITPETTAEPMDAAVDTAGEQSPGDPATTDPADGGETLLQPMDRDSAAGMINRRADPHLFSTLHPGTRPGVLGRKGEF